MIKIGILGGIGSGKSFISKQFGYPVFDADKQVKKIYKSDKNCFFQLKKKLQNYIYSFPIKKSQLTKVLNKLKPYNLGYDLIRIGSDNDAGYLVPNILNEIEMCFYYIIKLIILCISRSSPK